MVTALQAREWMVRTGWQLIDHITQKFKFRIGGFSYVHSNSSQAAHQA